MKRGKLSLPNRPKGMLWNLDSEPIPISGGMCECTGVVLIIMGA
jgi:hypothetical protein